MAGGWEHWLKGAKGVFESGMGWRRFNRKEWGERRVSGAVKME
jgi:hypothetical protein